jgi:hypothetical protein
LRALTLLLYGQAGFPDEGSQRTSKRKITLYGRIQQVLTTDNIPALRRVIDCAVTQCQMSPELVFQTLWLAPTSRAEAGTSTSLTCPSWLKWLLDRAFLVLSIVQMVMLLPLLFEPSLMSRILLFPVENLKSFEARSTAISLRSLTRSCCVPLSLLGSRRTGGMLVLFQCGTASPLRSIASTNGSATYPLGVTGACTAHERRAVGYVKRDLCRGGSVPKARS